MRNHAHDQEQISTATKSSHPVTVGPEAQGVLELFWVE